MISLVYFAWVRERIGVDGQAYALHEPTLLGALIDALAGLSPGHAAAFADRTLIRAAINQAFAGPESLVHPGDEVALFPPVTGG
jgi:molybdopterin converting factor subunit 1